MKLFLTQVFTPDCNSPEDPKHVFRVDKAIDCIRFKIGALLTEEHVNDLCEMDNYTVTIS